MERQHVKQGIEMVTVSYRFIEMIHRHISVSECCIAVSSEMKTFQLGGKLVKVQTLKRAVKQCSKRSERFYPIRKLINTEANNSKVSGSP